MADETPESRGTPHIRVNSGPENLPPQAHEPVQSVEHVDHHEDHDHDQSFEHGHPEELNHQPIQEPQPIEYPPQYAAELPANVPQPPLAPPPPPPPIPDSMPMSAAPTPESTPGLAQMPTPILVPTTGATIIPEGAAPGVGVPIMDGVPHVGQALTPGLPSPTPSTGTFGHSFASPNPQESSELLIPPRMQMHRGIRDEMDPARSPDISALSSRRTSWSSSALGTHEITKGGLGYGPYHYEDTAAPPSATGSEDTDVNTQTVSEKYNIMPTEGLLLFPEDVEKDDYLHNPDGVERDRRCCDFLSRRGFMNIGGLLLFTLGLLALFIAYPVVTAVKNRKEWGLCDPGDTLCLDVGDRPLLHNVRKGLIDPDTPESLHHKKDENGKEMKLVFSDEFNKDGRTFYEDDDPYLQGMDFWYGVTQDLEWYDPDAVTTRDGVLELRFDNFTNHELNYRSGMVQSWNKMCFRGGRLEASISLPGDGSVSGFWPGFWAMGNLGRPGYRATTDGMWPYSYYNGCDAGIMPNQSSPDGINSLPGMRLPACTCEGGEHPSPGHSRGAPEIDVIEASVAPMNKDGKVVGSVSQSLQMAPFDVWYMPDYDYTAVYDPRITQINDYRGGPLQQAMSGLTNLNNHWYNDTEYQLYAFEYTPGDTGDVTWYVGKDKTWTLDARALGPNGNVGQRMIPNEPMSIVMNLGMAYSFAPVDEIIKNYLPGFMRIDYVRIYQDPDEESVTCDPPGYETTEYIKNHPVAYQNMNVTTWVDAGYEWPKNSLMHGCKAEV